MAVLAKMSSKGQIVIPASLRKKYRLKAGVRIAIQEEGRNLVLRPNPFDAFLALQGMIKEPILRWLEEDKAAERLREDAR